MHGYGSLMLKIVLQIKSNTLGFRIACIYVYIYVYVCVCLCVLDIDKYIYNFAAGSSLTQ